jgi:hypothetical protein
VTATNRTVKGVEYAVFDAAPGDYVAGYGSDPTPPAISALRATPNADGTATVTWRTDEPSTSRVRFGTSAESLTGDAGASALVRDHSVTLTGLSAATRYSYRVSSADAAGAVASSPAASDAPASFVTAGPTMADTTVADFTAGTTADTAVQRAGDGEVALRPAVGEEFDGDGLPLSFMSVPWGTGGAATVSGGALRVDGARTGPQATFGPGRSLEFSATFRPDVFQFAGFGVELWTTPWAIFSSAGPSGQLYARSNNGTQSEQSTPIPGVHSGVPHRYRIDWTPTGFVYWVDGVQVASHAVATSTAMRPIVSDHYAGGGDISVAWLRMSPHATPGTYTSRVLDAGAAGTRWLELEATATTPAGTQIDLSTRSGGTATPDDGWTSWRPVAASGAIASPAGRYIQYRAELSTSAPSVTPALERVQVHYALDSDPNHPPSAGTVGLAPAAPTTAGTLTATPSGFSDPDGDSLDYRYRWLRNGTAIAGQTGDSLDLSAAGHGDRGDTVTVEVTATDGSALSPSASAAATIANAAPTRGTVALSPSAPRTDSTLTATVSGFGDADGDALTYEYRWLRDDAPIAGATAATLDLSAPGHGDADDEIAVEVTAVDAGGARSAAAGADVTIAPADTTAPVISARTATVEGDNGIAITWRTDEPASSRVQYGTSAGALTGEASAAALVTEHRIVLRGLAPGTLHHFRAVSADESGNGTTSPAAAQAPDTFTTPPARFLDSSMADFAAGTRSATHVGGTSHTADGEVVLRPQIGEEFEGTGLPSGWGFDTWNDGVDPTVGGGVLRTDGARVGTGDFFAPGRSLEFVGTFGGSVFQHVGLGYGLWGAPWAIFSTYDDSDDVYARTNATGTDVVTRIDGVDGSQPHRYRIDWTSTGFEYWIDGTRVATHATPIEAEMRPLVSDYYNGGGRTSVAWLRMTPYAAAGTFTSRVFDAGAAGSTWQTLESDADVPAGTALTLETRSGDAPTPDATWSGWQPLGAGGAIASPAGRHLQYRATLTSSASASSPTLRRAEIAYAPAP